MTEANFDAIIELKLHTADWMSTTKKDSEDGAEKEQPKAPKPTLREQQRSLTETKLSVFPAQPCFSWKRRRQHTSTDLRHYTTLLRSHGARHS